MDMVLDDNCFAPWNLSEDNWSVPNNLSRTSVYPLANIQRYWLRDDQVSWEVYVLLYEYN